LEREKELASEIETLVDGVLTPQEKSNVRGARIRQLAERLYALSIIKPNTPDEVVMKVAEEDALVAELKALRGDLLGERPQSSF